MIREALILGSDQSREALRQGVTLLLNPNLTRQQYLNHQFDQLSLSLSSSLTHGHQYSRVNQSYRSVNQNQKMTASISQCQERPINGSELSTTPLIAVSKKKTNTAHGSYKDSLISGLDILCIQSPVNARQRASGPGKKVFRYKW